MSESPELALRVELLRSAFDASFAQPLAELHSDSEQLLTVRVGESRLALPVRELALVERCRGLVPLPDAPEGCLGVAGVRGKLVAIYELSISARTGEQRWLIVSLADPQLGFAIDAVEQCQRVDRRQLSQKNVPADEPLHAVAVIGAEQLPVLSLDRLVRRLHARIEGSV